MLSLSLSLSVATLHWYSVPKTIPLKAIGVKNGYARCKWKILQPSLSLAYCITESWALDLACRILSLLNSSGIFDVHLKHKYNQQS